MPKERYFYVDFLKVISFFAIVLLHTSAMVAGTMGGGSNWDYIILLNAITRFGVPIFILCSGAMILQNNIDDLKKFFTRRFAKVVVPFLLWGLIYEFYKGVTDFHAILKDFFFQNVMYHLWFVYTIILLYLFAPIIESAVKNLTQQKLKYIFGLWIFFSMLVSFEYATTQGYSGIYILVEFSGYFIAGWIVHNQKFKLLNLDGLKIFLLDIFIFGSLTYLVIFYTEKLSQYYENFFEPYFILIVIGSVLTFKYFRGKEEFFRRHINFSNFLSKVSILTYGGYLVHILTLEYTKQIFLFNDGIFSATPHPVISTLACAALTGILSLLIIKILNLLPILKYFT